MTDTDYHPWCAAILADIEDHLPSLAYSDWLEDRGMPTAAEIVRRSLVDGGKSAIRKTMPGRYVAGPTTHLNYTRRSGDRVWYVLSLGTGRPTDSGGEYASHILTVETPDEAMRLLSGLENERIRFADRERQHLAERTAAGVI